MYVNKLKGLEVTKEDRIAHMPHDTMITKHDLER